MAGWIEPEPGDVDGNPMYWSTILARGCEREDLCGWEFKRTWAFVGETFDPDLPPDGGGWERNVHKAGGFEIRVTRHSKRQQISYWRRKQVRGL